MEYVAIFAGVFIVAFVVTSHLRRQTAALEKMAGISREEELKARRNRPWTKTEKVIGIALVVVCGPVFAVAIVAILWKGAMQLLGFE